MPGRRSERPARGEEPWTPTGESLREYLWHFLLVESTLTSEHMLSVVDVPREQLERFLTGWARLPVRPWRWPAPDSALWYRDGALALTFANVPRSQAVGRDTDYGVFVGGRDEEALARIDRLDLPWDMDTSAS